MNIRQLKDSRFLKKEDAGRGILVTVAGGEEINIALEGQPADVRFCLRFEEVDKPMILNSTNAQIMAAVFSSEETNDWVGKKIVLYNDPNISFQGKLIGGLRARAPKVAVPPTGIRPRPAPAPAPAQPAPAPAQPAAPAAPAAPRAEPLPGSAEGDDDIPF